MRDRKCLVDFNAEKTQLVLFDRSNNCGAVAVKLDGSVHVEKSSFNGLGLSFSSKFDWSPTLSVLQNMRPRKLEP